MPFVSIDSTTRVYVVDGFHILGDHLASARSKAAAYEIAQAALGTGDFETERLQRDTYYWLERAAEALTALQRRARSGSLTILEAVDYDRRMATATDLMTSIYAILATTDEQEHRA